MSLGKIKSGAAAVLLIAAVAVMVWQQHQRKNLANENAGLREELRQAATLHETDQQLMHQLRADIQRSEAERLELPRLRAQASRLRESEKENARLKIEHDRLAKQARQLPSAKTEEPEKTPEEKFRAAKLAFGRSLGVALIFAADDNDQRLPAELPRAIAEMESKGITASHFELVYSGSLRDVKNPSDTIIAREKEPFQQADGRWARIYVFADGSSRRLAAETPEGLARIEKKLSAESKP